MKIKYTNYQLLRNILSSSAIEGITIPERRYKAIMKRETLEELINYNYAACCATCNCHIYHGDEGTFDFTCEKYDIKVDSFKICDGYESDGETF